MRNALYMCLPLVLLGCGQASNVGQRFAAEGEAVSHNMAPMELPGIVADPKIPASSPAQIAYSYTVGYRLDDGNVPAVQAHHIAVCNKLGAARCRIASTSLRNDDDDAGYVNAEAKFLVDARLAQAFIARLDESSAAAGGSVADRSINAEDITKQIIDTDARVRAKHALADRLVRLVQNGGGKVGELVEAEKAYSDTQEELDAARSNQANLRQRVAMSDVSVNYSSALATGAWSPVTLALGGVGATLAASIGALVTFAVAALPWILVLAVIIWTLRRRGWRFRWRFWRRPAGD